MGSRTSGNKHPSFKISKGQVLNPGGRPKVALDVKQIARTSCPQVMMRLIDISLGNVDDIPYAVQVRACELVLERGCGKVIQQVDATLRQGLPVAMYPADLTPEELAKAIPKLLEDVDYDSQE